MGFHPLLVHVPLPKLLFPFWYCLRICRTWTIYYCQMLHIQIHHFHPNWSSFYQLDLGWPSAFSNLKQDFGSRPAIEVRPQGWEHWTLASRPVVSDKSPSPSPLQRRIPTKMESSETSSISKAYVYVWIDTLSESPTLLVVWITSMGQSSEFPLPDHLDLPGSEFVFGIPQGPPHGYAHLLAKMESSKEACG